MTTKNTSIQVAGQEIALININDSDFISLTDIAKHKNMESAGQIISNWLRTRFTVEFMGLWEQLHNPDFKLLEFEGFKNDAGSNSFVLSPKLWIDKTDAIGLISRSGRHGGGTFAHKDIAFEFASWISPSFKLYLIKEFQRLKLDESTRLNQSWNLQRTLAKVNYTIHTDAIKANLIPKSLTREQFAAIYASEADLLNMALFGMTAKEWRIQNRGIAGNMRDHASIEQLVILSNLESINAMLIQQGFSASQRLAQLNQIAITQMQSLLNSSHLKKLK
ncbi:KilA-N domain-containing protein [Dyadobacter sp. CY347]|uniref:KilA-N domain-containing protein n=1 Tax=Dyadobacter sp. CY347 TaxID=2909336 RepID=UPI001F43AB45|nr:KilA-N domain-containing protein [Dyadobacter sp. CY347]MCF2488711.1 KilA-N domain-containing protein [Dyadobacter sp. CY347]